MLSDQQRKRVFNIIIINQCLGMISGTLFQNGFYLNYFTKLGLSTESIGTLFALPSFVSAFLMLPFAFFSDRMGKKRLALGGQLLLILNLVLMIAAGWTKSYVAHAMLVVSLLVFCVGGSLQAANWFALLNPIIPEEMRGRFFGRLRIIFQIVGILFSFSIARALKVNEGMATFQILLGIVLVAAIARYFTYARIPELENAGGEDNHREPLHKAIKAVLVVPGYIRFNIYLFLITLFSAGVPLLFGFMQKDVFMFSPAQISGVGTLLLVGSVVGCWVGGRTVDRYGTRVVFLATHFGYALAMLTMLLRHWVPWSLPVHVGVCVLLFTMVAGIAGVANTSEVLALIPAANKSLSTAVNMTLWSLAAALSVLIVSRVTSLSILSPEWQMFGHTYSAYDSLIIFYASMALLMLLTIGLVPRIVKKTQLMPGGTFPRP